jgi:ABC-type nitrate/sulfonate/bicarbonate transport system substrate-binding protein
MIFLKSDLMSSLPLCTDRLGNEEQEWGRASMTGCRSLLDLVHALLFRCVLAGLAVFVVGAASAQTGLEETEVAIAATRDTQVGVQLAVADALGYFQDEGLHVAPKWLQSGDETVQLLGSGAVPVGCNSTYGAILLAARGFRVSVVQGLADMSGTQGLVLSPGVNLRSPAELEGKRLAYTNGNPQILILARLAKLYGFDLGKITLVNMQPSEGLVAAQKGDVAGLLSFEPFLYRLTALGGTKYATGRQAWISGGQAAVGQDERLLHLNGVLLVQEGWIKNKPNTVKALMRAFDRATKFIRANQSKTIEILQRGIKIDRAALASALNANSYSSALTEDVAHSVSELSEWAVGIKRIAAPVKPSEIIDSSLLRALDPTLVTWSAQ